MKTNGTTSQLADAYLERPDYAPDALEAAFQYCRAQTGRQKSGDLGAGVAHLTIPLAKYGCIVDAVEPTTPCAQTAKNAQQTCLTLHGTKAHGEASGRPGGNMIL